MNTRFFIISALICGSVLAADPTENAGRRMERLKNLMDTVPALVFLENVEYGNAPRLNMSLSDGPYRGKPFKAGAAIRILTFDATGSTVVTDFLLDRPGGTFCRRLPGGQHLDSERACLVPAPGQEAGTPSSLRMEGLSTQVRATSLNLAVEHVEERRTALTGLTTNGRCAGYIDVCS